MKKYAFVLVLLFFVVFSAGLVNAAIIKTIPEKLAWAADGKTEYKLYVFVDNSGLNGEPTDNVEWGLADTLGLQYVGGSSSVPGVNDFFADKPMFWEYFTSPFALSSRIVDGIGGGPTNARGYVGVYKFKVPVGTAPGIYHFDLKEDTQMYNQDAESQPFVSESVSFNIVPKPIKFIRAETGLEAVLRAM